jgi:UDP-N-acetylglucosamine 2-epimerase (non-hydrolysing)
VGTRPEAIKLVPVIRALESSATFDPIVVSTGQHRDLVAPIFELAGITPRIDLEVGGPGSTLTGIVASVMERLDAFCRSEFGADGAAIATAEELADEGFPAATLVHGDTSSALGAALASFHLRIPVVHVEAGLRTDNTLSPFPEELNRQLISRIACFHLAPTLTNDENLVHEGIPLERVFTTGNTAIDAMRWAASLDVPYSDPRVAELADSDRRIVVVTAHRRENWGVGLKSIATAISELAETFPEVAFVVPLHPNPLVQDQLGAPLADYENVICTEPQPYVEFARLLNRAHFVISDSGGIQEEAPSVGTPVLVTRESTEREEGVIAGTLELVGTDPDRIVVAATRLLTNPAAYDAMARADNPYGDGHSAPRIVAALSYLAGFGRPPASFGPGFSRQAVLQTAGYPAGLDVAGEPIHARGLVPHDEELDRWRNP